MNVLKKMFKNWEDNPSEMGFDAWSGSEIDKGKVRNLVKVLVCSLPDPDPYTPDLNDVLKDVVDTDEQKRAVQKIWQEEVLKHKLK